MSQHWFTNKRNRKVLYGSDKPTGGFFFTEFYNDDEIGELEDDVVFTLNSLTIREFIKNFSETQHHTFPLEEIHGLISDWCEEKYPTQFQHSISAMFGKNLEYMLNRVESDLYGFLNE